MHYINKTRLFALTLTFTLLFTFILSYAKSVGSNISHSVVRLHIIANSNSETDQSLKLKIRDKIIEKSDLVFGKTKSTSQALQLARENSGLIQRIAEDEIKLLGFNYPVSVTVGEYPFPTKSYGEISLPAGKYNAVRIEIGSAQGNNWWCVMYPPLCFTDGILVASEESQKKLQNSLSPSEYKLITESSPSVEVKFKIVELFQKWF